MAILIGQTTSIIWNGEYYRFERVSKNGWKPLDCTKDKIIPHWMIKELDNR